MKAKRRKRSRILALLALATLAMFATGCGYSALDPGNPMPAFAVEGWTNGAEPDTSGKVVVIEAFATW